jgi:uncharacterized protein (DUF2267 family)
MNFEKYAAHAHAFVRDVAEELGMPGDLDGAGRILKAVMHALRSRLSVAESFHLLAQLPIVLKGVYVDEWKLPSGPDKHIRDEEDFVDEVIERAGQTALRDFPNPARTRHHVQGVFRVLKRHIARGQTEDIAGQLPKKLRMLWVDA